MNLIKESSYRVKHCSLMDASEFPEELIGWDGAGHAVEGRRVVLVQLWVGFHLFHALAH